MSLLAILMIIINWKNFKIDLLKHYPFIGIIMLFIGIIDFFMLAMIFLGDSGDTSKIGFSPALQNLNIGIGNWILVVCAVFIIVGAVTNINGFYQNR